MSWCSRLIGKNIRINELAIPGTHDAAAWTHNSGVWGIPGTWAHRKSITEQLELGVRVLDLRVGWTIGWSSKWFIGMYHGPVYLSSNLEDVLKEIKAWFEKNPKEFVILIFQQQGKASKADLSENVRELIENIFVGSEGDFFQFRNDLPYWPTVEELSGKVLVMGRLQKEVEGFCNVREWLTLGDNTKGETISAGSKLHVYLQDEYKGVKEAEKFTCVSNAATTILENPSRVLRINHMSYSKLPTQPWVLGTAMNDLLLKSDLQIRGVLMIDDADARTVDHILANNARL